MNLAAFSAGWTDTSAQMSIDPSNATIDMHVCCVANGAGCLHV